MCIIVYLFDIPQTSNPRDPNSKKDQYCLLPTETAFKTGTLLVVALELVQVLTTPAKTSVCAMLEQHSLQSQRSVVLGSLQPKFRTLPTNISMNIKILHKKMICLEIYFHNSVPALYNIQSKLCLETRSMSKMTLFCDLVGLCSATFNSSGTDLLVA